MRTGKLKAIKNLDDPNIDLDFFENLPTFVWEAGDLRILREAGGIRILREAGGKAPQVSSFLGKAGVVLDTLLSSVFSRDSRGNKISILSFEVANTIAKGANLLQTLSKENIRFLKEEILHSEGVQQLVSQDIEELLRIAAADKRKEFDVFSLEVIRFGNLCIDPQWHNLGRFFEIDSDLIVHRQFREEAERTMQELTTLAQHTSELYHEINALGRFEQNYRRKIEEVESLLLSQRGESLKILGRELKHQRMFIRNLKKKSLWPKSMEEVVEKLVKVIILIHQAILEAFGHNGLTVSVNGKIERLGVTGLASHYAKTITQIDDIVFLAPSLPPNMRDTLYNGLPSSVKRVLFSWVQRVDYAEELTVPQIKVEMEETLQWLVPVAKNTIIAHQGIGSVGEWANTGKEFGKMTGTHSSLIRLQTLYHADKQKMDMCVLELLMLLHRLIGRVRFGDMTNKSPTPKRIDVCWKRQITQDRYLLAEETNWRRLVPGISRSQEFVMAKRRNTKVWAPSRSTGSSPRKS